MSTVSCPHCHFENARDNEYCDHCGKKLPAKGGLICPHCLTVNQLSETTCRVCGNLLEGATELDLPDSKEEQRPELETWLSELPEILDTGELVKAKAQAQAQEDDLVPGWLDELQEHKGEPEDASGILDWLTQLRPGEKEKAETTAVEPATPRADVPDWVAALTPREEWPETDEDEILARTLAELEEETEEPLPPEMAQTKPLPHSRELDGVPERLVKPSLPDWITSDEVGDESPAGEEVEGRKEEPRIVVDSKPEPLPQEEPAAEAAVPEAEEEEFPDWLQAPGGLDLDKALDDLLVGDRPTDLADEDEAWSETLEQLSLEEEPSIPSREEKIDLPGDEAPPYKFDLEPGDAEVPDWLQARRPRVTGGAPTLIGEEPIETVGPLAGLRGVIRVAPELAEPKQISRVGPVTLTNEERQRIALLRGLTETAERPAEGLKHISDRPYRTQRAVLGIILLALILIGWLAPGLVDLVPSDLPQPAIDAADNFHNVVLSAEETVLVSFEYSPLYAGELNSIAAVLLQDLAQQGRSVLTVSQFATGVALAEETINQVEDLDSRSLGYLPGDAPALKRLGRCVGPVSSCNSLIGRELAGDVANRLDNVDLIVILTGDRDSLVNWIEQVGPQTETPMLAGVTQALSPVTLPYLASEQLQGSISGVTSAAAYEEIVTGSNGEAGDLMISVTLAQWLAIIVLIAGGLYYGLSGLTMRREKRGQGK